MENDSELLTEIPKEMSLVRLLVERMVMQMAQMTEMSWVHLMEKHSVRQMETKSVHPREKPKELRSVCLSVEMMAMRKVLLTEIGLVQLMVTQMARMKEIN